MTNRFKFRVWDKLAQRMIHPDKGYQQHFILDLNGRFYNLQNGSGGDEYVVQQYTGLNDSKGKEIYEGDILNCDLVGGDDPQTVIFKDGIFTLDYLTPGCYNLYDEINQMVGHKVIGNIFENSELSK